MLTIVEFALGFKKVFIMSQCFILNFAVCLPNISKIKLFIS